MLPLRAPGGHDRPWKFQEGDPVPQAANAQAHKAVTAFGIKSWKTFADAGFYAESSPRVIYLPKEHQYPEEEIENDLEVVSTKDRATVNEFVGLSREMGVSRSRNC